jgi:uncharacterized membrane protein YphA (DoxX/SURF4 family)
MENSTVSPVSKAALRTGWVLSILPCLLLLFSGAMKIIHPPQLDEGFIKMGIPVSLALGLGLLEVACTIIYLIPRTAVLGAILLTGYMGGAILTHLRIGEGFVPHVFFGVALWGGLWLREVRLRALLPLR